MQFSPVSSYFLTLSTLISNTIIMQKYNFPKKYSLIEKIVSPSNQMDIIIISVIFEGDIVT